MTHFDPQRRSDFLLEAQTSLKAAKPSDAVIRAERFTAINDAYIGTGRNLLAAGIDVLIDGTVSSSAPESNKLRNLFVIGESGSEKSITIPKHQRDGSEYQPRMVHGQQIKPMVSIDAPKPSTLKSFCRAAKQALVVLESYQPVKPTKKCSLNSPPQVNSVMQTNLISNGGNKNDPF